MQTVIKIFFLAGVLLVAGFFANLYGWVSIPWLEFNDVPTYSEDAVRTNDTLKEAFEK
jgi:hypothetical protein